MIIAHEWVGEPHNSQSVKKLYRPDEPLIEYEWVGEPNRSPSVKLSNGDVVGENLSLNPHLKDVGADPGFYNNYGSIEHLETTLKGIYNRKVHAHRIERIVEISEPGVYTYTIHAKIDYHEDVVVEWSGERGAVYISPRKYPYSEEKWDTYSITFRVDDPGEVYLRLYTRELEEGQGWEADWEKLEKGYEFTGYFDGDSKHVHGNETARNLSENPHFENTNARVMNGINPPYGRNSVTDSIFTHEITGLTGGSNRFQKSFHLEEAGTYTYTFLANFSDDMADVTDLEWRSPVGVTYEGQTVREVLDGWGEYSVTFHVSETSSKKIIRLYTRGESVGDKWHIDWELLTPGTVTDYFDGDTPDYQVPNTKIYYDGKWVSLYDYHA